jgi:hypothetical protein
MKQSDWLRSISEPAVFLHPARSETQLHARSGFRGKNRGVKQFLNEKICPKRLKIIA